MTIVKSIFSQAKNSLRKDPENGRTGEGLRNESSEPLTNAPEETVTSHRRGKVRFTLLHCMVVVLSMLLMTYMVLTAYRSLYRIQEIENKRVMDLLTRLRLNSNGDPVLEDYVTEDPFSNLDSGETDSGNEELQKTFEEYPLRKNLDDILNSYGPIISMKSPKSSMDISKTVIGTENDSTVQESAFNDAPQSADPRANSDFESARNFLDSIKRDVDTFKMMLNKEFPEDAKISLPLGIPLDSGIHRMFEGFPLESMDGDETLDSMDLMDLESEEDFNNEKKVSWDSNGCANVAVNLRFDCHPEDGASELSCADRGCCWVPVGNKNCDKSGCPGKVPLNTPYCYYPDNWPGYKMVNESKDDNVVTRYFKRDVKSYYKNDISLIKMEATTIDKSTLRMKIFDPANPRYEPPWPVRSEAKPFSSISDVKFSVESSHSIGFKVKRAEDQTTLFDSTMNTGFIFSDQFLQIQSLLPSHNIYGLGEHRTNLKLSTNWQSFTMFNADQPPTEKANLYGSHPFYLIMEDSGKSHGVLFLNSNAMDVILQPTPAITFRSIGGIFDIYFFMGPTPADVLRQYSEIVGKPFMPPYWSLGFHLCRFGYGSLDYTKQVWNRTRNAGIPFDTQWNDLDYMNQGNDFTYDKEKFKDLPKFIDELHAQGMHYIPLVDAGVSASEVNGTYPPWDEGLRQKIFVKDAASNQPFAGKVWNKVSTAWPDFTDPKAQDYYTAMMQDMHNEFAYDGAWIDMNEPSNFYNGERNGCSQNDLDYPEYMPNTIGRVLATKTLCMNAKHYLGPHYNLHNTYGMSQAVITSNALKTIRQKRPFVISRSTWQGHGFYAGHWTGDIYSSWHDLRMSIPEILAFSFFQIPMVGADICGFDGNTTEALCNRWMQLGAFYPFSRNHNSDDTTEQDPVAMGDMVVKSSRKALMIRYRFLPYLYTLFFKAHRFGDTVARPLFIEFAYDEATYDIDTQFLWGSSLMIIPVLDENKTEVTAYVPRGRWFDFYTKASFYSRGKNISLQAPLDTIPLLVRGGSVLPAQTPAPTTTASRKNNFELLVALDNRGSARGEMYWDDGDSLETLEKLQYRWLEFRVKNQTLTSSEVEKGLFDEDMTLGKVCIMGIDENVNRVSLNGNDIGFTYDSNRSYLQVKGLLVDLKKSFSLSWTYG